MTTYQNTSNTYCKFKIPDVNLSSSQSAETQKLIVHLLQHKDKDLIIFSQT